MKVGVIMQYRMMEKLGVQPSLLGFGCMRFPQLVDGHIDEQESEKLMDLAISQGVNYIDTAYFYHNGESEAFVGKVLAKYPRDTFYLATKMPMVFVKSLEQAKEIFAEQLQRLQVDYVDFYLLHALNRAKWKRALELGIVDFLEDLQRQGKIRHFGFSFHDDYEFFEEVMTYRSWDFCQIQLNYVDTDHQQGMRGYVLAEKLGVPLVIMEPVKGGSLATLPDDIAAQLKSYDKQSSIASWAFRWIASLPGVKVVLSGMSDRSQVEDNLCTFTDLKLLNTVESGLVEQVATEIKVRQKNACTSCAYCMPCPFGVNIPACFAAWNAQAMYNYKEKTRQQYYIEMAAAERADQCRQCGKCEQLCPQDIAIRENLAQAAKDLAF